MSVFLPPDDVDPEHLVIVRDIIITCLTKNGRVSSYHVVELLKGRIRPNLLFNYIANTPSQTKDAEKNIHRGAERLFRLAVPHLLMGRWPAGR